MNITNMYVYNEYLWYVDIQLMYSMNITNICIQWLILICMYPMNITNMY